MTKSLKIKGLSEEEVREAFPYDPAIVCYRGSIVHGMYVPQEDPNSIDDKDLMGVVIPPIEKYFGLNSYEGQKDRFIREFDIVVYEYRKFVRLLLKANPNVLSALWLKPKHYIYVSQAGLILIANRDLFSSLRVYHSFTGYAYSQLKRMQVGAYKGYMGEKRKKLVAKYGFDPKNAAHLIRLLRMGIEFLKEGIMYVEREDASELLDIKNGKWSLEKVEREADILFVLAKEVYAKSPLPPKPDTKKVEALLVKTLEEHFRR